jgi:hypothetical protein
VVVLFFKLKTRSGEVRQITQIIVMEPSKTPIGDYLQFLKLPRSCAGAQELAEATTTPVLHGTLPGRPMYSPQQQQQQQKYGGYSAPTTPGTVLQISEIHLPVIHLPVIHFLFIRIKLI